MFVHIFVQTYADTMVSLLRWESCFVESHAYVRILGRSQWFGNLLRQSIYRHLRFSRNVWERCNLLCKWADRWLYRFCMLTQLLGLDVQAVTFAQHGAHIFLFSNDSSQSHMLAFSCCGRPPGAALFNKSQLMHNIWWHGRENLGFVCTSSLIARLRCCFHCVC